MKDLQPGHHVFSSAGGYRTLHASADLDEHAVRVLEAFASASQRAYSHGQSYSCLSLTDGGPIVLSCTFVHGADHVGRRRLCTHSVVLPAGIREQPGFHPAAPAPDQFMSKEVPAERPGHFLSTSWPLPNEGQVRAQQRRAIEAFDDKNAELMTALLSPSRTVVLASSSSEGLARLASVGWLLPPRMRAALRYRSGFWPPDEMHVFGRVSAVLLHQASKLEEYPEGEFVHINFYAEGEAEEELNVAEGFGHPYVELLLELGRASDGMTRLDTFLAWMETCPGPALPSVDQQSCLVGAYRRGEAGLRELAQTGAVRRHVPELIASLSLLARSGRTALAESLVQALHSTVGDTDRATVKRSIAALHRLLQEDFYLQGHPLGRMLTEYGRELRRSATTRHEPT